MGRPLHQKLGDDQRQYHEVTAEIAAARKEVIHDAAVLANHYRSLRAEIQKERAERQAARAEVKAPHGGRAAPPVLARDRVLDLGARSWRSSARSWPG